MMRVKTTWQPCLVQTRHSVLLIEVENEHICFQQKENGTKAMTLWVPFGFFYNVHFWCQSLKNTASTPPEIFFFQYFTILVANLMTLVLS